MAETSAHVDEEESATAISSSPDGNASPLSSAPSGSRTSELGFEELDEGILISPFLQN